MAEPSLRERTLKPASPPVRPPPPVPMIRRVPHWRRSGRVHIEHWIAGAIVVVAFANAVRLLAF
jgi:hypothetical protein